MKVYCICLGGHLLDTHVCLLANLLLQQKQIQRGKAMFPKK